MGTVGAPLTLVKTVKTESYLMPRLSRIVRETIVI